ncbi:MAG: glutathione S-transferase family protein [Bacteroidota bacterium]
MRTLFHHPLCPFSRKVRIVLAEGHIPHEIFQEAFWCKREEFLDLNPLGEVPTLCWDDSVMTQSQAISEFLVTCLDYKGPLLMSSDNVTAFKIRSECLKADDAFYNQVVKKIISEKYLKRQQGHGGPDSRVLRSARNAVRFFLELINWTLERQNWISSQHYSLADVSFASHISSIDYFGAIDWDFFPEVKSWYARIKSRPSFSSLLHDKIPGIAPAAHYSDLDF